MHIPQELFNKKKSVTQERSYYQIYKLNVFVGIKSMRTTQSINKRYFDVVVSFWKKDAGPANLMLCVGALIRSNIIVTTAECIKILFPRKEIGVQTGTMKFDQIDPSCIIKNTQEFSTKSQFAVVIVSSYT